MDTLELLQQIKRHHDYYNRWLTFGLGLLVSAVCLGLWWTGVVLVNEYKSLTGIILMFLAFVFYKLPYFAYWLNRRRYRNHSKGLDMMGKNWKQYRTKILLSVV